jgi:hypothetical protein
LKIRSSAAFYRVLGGADTTSHVVYDVDGAVTASYFAYDLSDGKVARELIFQDATAQLLRGDSVLILPIISSEDSPYLEPQERQIYGIVLQACTRVEGAFTRVGAFDVGDERISDFHSARKAARASQQTYYFGEPTGKVDEDGKEEYVMTIY